MYRGAFGYGFVERSVYLAGVVSECLLIGPFAQRCTVCRMCGQYSVLTYRLPGSLVYDFSGAVGRYDYQWYSRVICFGYGWVVVQHGRSRCACQRHRTACFLCHAEGEKRCAALVYYRIAFYAAARKAYRKRCISRTRRYHCVSYSFAYQYFHYGLSLRERGVPVF